jgi:phosphoinositide-3-kinase regulatory subunit 4
VLPEAKLSTGKSISLIELGVTPQTVFISPRTVGVVDTRLDLKRLRPDLAGDTPSRRTSFASRSARGAPGDGANPLEEVRKRLASLEPPSRTSVERGERPDVAHTGSLQSQPSRPLRTHCHHQVADTGLGQRPHQPSQQLQPPQ